LLKTFPNQSSKAEQQDRKKKSGVSASETQANAVRFLSTNQPSASTDFSNPIKQSPRPDLDGITWGWDLQVL
jgi:hypothetical protein